MEIFGPPLLDLIGSLLHVFAWDRTYNPGVITDAIFSAFLNCETKSYLKFSGEAAGPNEFVDWRHEVREDYRRKCHSWCSSIFPEHVDILYSSSLEDLKGATHRLALDCTVETPRLRSRVDAVELVSRRSNGKCGAYIPIRFVPNEKLSTHDKLLLAFDALTLGEALGKAPPLGKIVHGAQPRIAKVKLATLVPTVRSITENLLSQEQSHQPPQLILNKHCAECEFRSRCRRIALEKGDLSLLPRIGKLERGKLHERGIFSIQQLSYTFRVRRKPKKLAPSPHRQFHALKALAIREQKIYILGQPQLNLNGSHIFLDVEGVPDRDFYYLIGLRIRNGETCAQYSFWADDVGNEKEIWTALVTRLAAWTDSHLITYGSYESTFLKRMVKRYPEVAEDLPWLDSLISEPVNVLQLVSSQVYFPTYSNNLKEVAQYLGFRWSESCPSGLRSLMWRSQWERTRDTNFKERIITYNAEDCAALENVFDCILRLSQHQDGEIARTTDRIVHAESIKSAGSYRFGKMEFSLPELDYINKAAYWDYQRNRVYVRSSPRLKQLARRGSIKPARKLLPNKIVECQPPRPATCPRCQAGKIYKYGKLSKTVYDLRLGPLGIKRWVVKYRFPRFLCWRCKTAFVSHHQLGQEASTVRASSRIFFTTSSICISLKQPLPGY